ncbi:MAG TPA: hypothetical protein VFO39_05830 [Candidatus Sulfotelmatobacter sp.]|nr:hypothetical protein [Candidatus Sulfotelmatobacter sp.]
MEKFGRLAFEGVSDELEGPTEKEEKDGVPHDSMQEDGSDEECDGKDDGWNAQRVTGAVHRMLMAGGVLGDPFLIRAVLAGAVAEHAGNDTSSSGPNGPALFASYAALKRRSSTILFIVFLSLLEWSAKDAKDRKDR